MIKKAIIRGLYKRENTATLNLEKDLFILTGDNGSGKTTILNMIYYGLNGDFEWFINKNFNKMLIIFKENDKNLRALEIYTEDNQVFASYKFNYGECRIKVTAHPFFKGFRYEMVDGNNVKMRLPEKDWEKNGGYFKVLQDTNSSLEELIGRTEKLDFIYDIRKSLLYFPTYRRIDSDIKNLIESKIDSDHSLEDLSIDFNINNFKNDRRVIGVGDQDIEEIFNDYTNRLREFNSEGLNNLLKKFIKSTIESLYKEKNVYNTEEKVEQINEFLTTESSPRHLLELADRLEIDNLNREKINRHYLKQKENRENLRKYIRADKHNRNNELAKEMVFEILGNLDNENQVVNELTNLYAEHLREQEKVLNSYYFLKEGFELFFNKKIAIELNMNNFNLNLSRPFSKLSTGEKQLITILSYSGLGVEESTFQSLIIIDEPELSLHVSWQGKLLNQLTKKINTQLLLATHSPYVARTTYMPYVHQLGEIDEYDF